MLQQPLTYTKDQDTISWSKFSVVYKNIITNTFPRFYTVDGIWLALADSY